MTNLGAIEPIHDWLEPFPERPGGMSGNGDPTLTMDFVDLRSNVQRGIDRVAVA